VVEIAFRQVSWLGPSTAVGGDAAFSRVSAQWRTKRRFKGLTVAVTTRDSHPLPYSLIAPVCSSALWRLNINRNNSVGAGFPRPIALLTDAGGENPPLRCRCFIYSKTIRRNCKQGRRAP